MKTLAYYNGKIGEIEEMTVPFNERAHWFGDGVYDAATADNHVVFCLDAHIERFFRSASIAKIELNSDERRLARLLRELSLMVDSPRQFVYWQATRASAGPRKHAFRSNANGDIGERASQPNAAQPNAAQPNAAQSNLWVMITPQDAITAESMSRKLKLVTVLDNRFFMCDAKTLNLLPNVLASAYAEESGCDEAIFHRDGRVTECAHSNLGIIKDGVFITAPLDNLLLPGVSRANLLRYCDELGIPSRQEPFFVGDLFLADEVIVTACTKLCMAAGEIDGKPVGGRAPDLLGRLRAAALEHFMRETAAK